MKVYSVSQKPRQFARGCQWELTAT